MPERITLGEYAFEASVLQRVPTLLHYPVRVRRFRRGEAVTRFQEPIRELQFMVEGRARVYSVMDNGRAVLHTTFQGFEVIGDLEFFRGYPLATTDIQAVTDITLLAVSLEKCREQLWADVSMLRFLGAELARKLERSSRQAAQNLLYPLSVRLAAYMLFSAQEGFFGENLIHVSELMATSYRHLLRTLKDFCQMGAICRKAGGYWIVDEKRLTLESKSLLWEQGGNMK